MRDLSFDTAALELLMQVLINSSFILPAAFLCFYSVGPENLKRSHLRIALACVLAALVYGIVAFVLWYLFDFPDSLLTIPLLVVGFLYYKHVTNPGGMQLFFVFLFAAFVARFSNAVFNLMRRMLFEMEPDNLWRWPEVLVAVVVALVITPAAAWFMRNRVWPVIAGAKTTGQRYLWILPTVLVMVMLPLNLLLSDYMVEFNWYEITLALLLALAAGVSLVQVLYVMRTQQESARQREALRVATEQGRRYAEAAAHTEEVKLLRHDMRHHLSVLDSMLREKRYTEAETYLKQYGAETEVSEPPLCACYVVDVIARRYKAQAEEAGICADFRLLLPEDPGVSGIDLCVLLGNLLENALNACKAQHQGSKFIQVLARVEGSEIVISTENSCNPGEVGREQGLGLPSARALAEKYDGFASFVSEDGRFSASVLLRRQTQRS